MSLPDLTQSGLYLTIATYFHSLSVDQVRQLLIATCITFWVLNSTVSYLNILQLDRPLPSLIKKLYSKEVLDKYESHKDYIRAKSAFGQLSGIYDHVISFAMWGMAFYPYLDDQIKLRFSAELTPDPTKLIFSVSKPMRGVIYSLAFSYLGSILSLPISWYKTFVLEEKFGFNRTTYLTFMKDFVKEQALTTALGFIAFYCIFWIVINYAIEQYWWMLVCFAISMQIVILMLQPWIMKLFMSFIDINEGVAYCTKGKSASKVVKNRYFYPVVSDSDKTVREDLWETRDSQFKGQKKGAIVQLRKEAGGTWVLAEKKVTQESEEMKEVTKEEANSSDPASDFTYASQIAPSSAKFPEDVKEWAVQCENLSATTEKESEEVDLKKEMEKQIDPSDSLPFHLKKVDFTELRSRLQSMADEHNFTFKNVCVVDGSTRSEHSNAFFMGFWWFRRICLFDTLLKNLSADSICGVLGHEMGHCVMKHIPKSFVLGIIQMSMYIWLFAQMVYNKQLHGAFYVDTSNSENITIWIGFYAAGIVLEPINLFVEFFMNWHTRKNEYEADAFAVKSFKQNYAVDLVTGLKTLASENKSHLNPHWLFVMWKHSHPTLDQRAQWIAKLSKERDGKELDLENLGCE